MKLLSIGKFAKNKLRQIQNKDRLIRFNFGMKNKSYQNDTSN
jgi:hypothetical protein